MALITHVTQMLELKRVMKVPLQLMGRMRTVLTRMRSGGQHQLVKAKGVMKAHLHQVYNHSLSLLMMNLLVMKRTVETQMSVHQEQQQLLSSR